MTTIDYYIEGLKIFIDLKDVELERQRNVIKIFERRQQDNITKIWNLEERCSQMDHRIEELEAENKRLKNELENAKIPKVKMPPKNNPEIVSQSE